MDPDTAVSALNRPWWLSQPDNSRAMVQALQGGQPGLYPGEFQSRFWPIDTEWQPAPGGFAEKIMATGEHMTNPMIDRRMEGPVLPPGGEIALQVLGDPPGAIGKLNEDEILDILHGLPEIQTGYDRAMKGQSPLSVDLGFRDIGMNLPARKIGTR